MAQVLAAPMEAVPVERPPAAVRAAPVRAPFRSRLWTRPSSSFALPACAGLAACVARARWLKRPPRNAYSKHSTARAARAVSVVVENSARQELADCDAEWMEQLLQERAAEILFNGVERTEPASEDGLIYLYFPSLDIGPYSSQVPCMRLKKMKGWMPGAYWYLFCLPQVRMTCRINLEKPQRAEVQAG